MKYELTEIFNYKRALYRQLSMFDMAVVFAGNVVFEQASIMVLPYSEIQPHPGPSLRTTDQ